MALCETLASECGTVLEKHYETFTTADINKITSVGMNTIRTPTNRAAWVIFPGSEFYHGHQQSWLKKITEYYSMHVIII